MDPLKSDCLLLLQMMHILAQHSPCCRTPWAFLGHYPTKFSKPCICFLSPLWKLLFHLLCGFLLFVSSLNIHFLYRQVPVLSSLCKWSLSSKWVVLLLTSPFSSQVPASHLHSVILSPLPCFNWPCSFMLLCPCTMLFPLSWTSHIICTDQCKMKTRSFLSKNYYEFQDGDIGTLSQSTDPF